MTTKGAHLAAKRRAAKGPLRSDQRDALRDPRGKILYGQGDDMAGAAVGTSLRGAGTLAEQLNIARMW